MTPDDLSRVLIELAAEMPALRCQMADLRDQMAELRERCAHMEIVNRGVAVILTEIKGTLSDLDKRVAKLETCPS